jgi:hypothetical protein
LPLIFLVLPPVLADTQHLFLVPFAVLLSLAKIVARSVVLSPKKNKKNTKTPATGVEDIQELIPKTMAELIVTIQLKFDAYDTLYDTWQNLTQEHRVQLGALTESQEQVSLSNQKCALLAKQIEEMNVMKTSMHQSKEELSATMRAERISNHQDMLAMNEASMVNQKEVLALRNLVDRLKDDVVRGKRVLSEMDHGRRQLMQQVQHTQEHTAALEAELKSAREANRTAAEAIEDVIRDNKYQTNENTSKLTKTLTHAEEAIDHSIDVHRRVMTGGRGDHSTRAAMDYTVGDIFLGSGRGDRESRMQKIDAMFQQGKLDGGVEDDDGEEEEEEREREEEEEEREEANDYYPPYEFQQAMDMSTSQLAKESARMGQTIASRSFRASSRGASRGSSRGASRGSVSPRPTQPSRSPRTSRSARSPRSPRSARSPSTARTSRSPTRATARSPVAQPTLSSSTSRGRTGTSKPEWQPLVDTSAPRQQKSRLSDLSEPKNARAKSASPVHTFRPTEPRVKPLRSSRARSRSPLHAPPVHEITKGTYWGLYSDTEAKRKKTEDYFRERREEEEGILLAEQRLKHSPRKGRSVPDTASKAKEDLYRKLRGNEHRLKI